MSDRFRRCLAFLLSPEIEGGVSNHPADHGGLTNRGITAWTWQRAQRLGLVPKDRRLLAATRADIERVYEAFYWIPSRAPKLPVPLDRLAFDGHVNHRPSVAAGFVQAAVGVPVDGIIGPVTLRAAAGADPRAALDGFLRARRAFYARLIATDPSQKAFKRGWENRMVSLEREALADIRAGELAPEAR